MREIYSEEELKEYLSGLSKIQLCDCPYLRKFPEQVYYRDDSGDIHQYKKGDAICTKENCKVEEQGDLEGKCLNINPQENPAWKLKE